MNPDMELSAYHMQISRLRSRYVVIIYQCNVLNRVMQTLSDVPASRILERKWKAG
jgi:hypothetical protein